MQEAAGGKAVAQAADQLVGKGALGRADRFGVPFRRFKIKGRDKGRLPPHGQAHIARRQCRIDAVPQGIQIGPGGIGKRLGDARMFGDAGHRHVKGKINLGIARHTRNRRSVAVMGRGRQRDMAFAGQQARGRIEPDPARAGQIGLCPGVQVGEIDGSAGRAVQCQQIGFQLHQIARDEAGGKAKMPQRLHQEPRGVPARALAAGKGFFGRLNARFHPDDIGHGVGHAGVQTHDEIDGAQRVARNGGQKGAEKRPGGVSGAIDRQVGRDVIGIGKGPGLSAVFDKEIERVIDCHVGDQINLDLQLAHRLGKDKARQPVAIGILLMVHEMPGGADLQAVRQHAGAAVRGGAQTDDLGPQDHGPVIGIVGQMVDGGKDRHDSPQNWP